MTIIFNVEKTVYITHFFKITIKIIVLYIATFCFYVISQKNIVLYIIFKVST